MGELIYEDEEGEEALSGTHRPEIEVMELGAVRPDRLEQAFRQGLSGLARVLGMPLDLEGRAATAVHARVADLASRSLGVGALVARTLLAGGALGLQGKTAERPKAVAYYNLLAGYGALGASRRGDLERAAKADLALL